MRLRWAFAIVMCACTSSAPMTYTLSAAQEEPMDRPPPAIAPTLFIDGEPRNVMTVTYASDAAAIGALHTIELRFGDDNVVASVNRTLGTDPAIRPTCDPGDPGPVTVLDEQYCAFASGDLRVETLYGGTASSFCIADGFCTPECVPGSCAQGERCTRIVASIEPPASHLGCAADGTEHAGAPCAITDSLDNCDAISLCVEGTCHALCTLGAGSDGCTCSYVDGVPPELTVCL